MRKFLCLALLAWVGACGGNTDSGTSGGGGGDDAGSSGDDASSGDDGGTATGTPLARGLTISVGVFQATSAMIVKGGALQATPNAPVVANRPGVLRVYVTPDDTWQAHDVTAELHLNAGGMDLPVQTATLTVSGPSSDTTPNSTFDFKFTADQMPAGTTFSVVIRDPSASPQADDATGAWFPNDGTQADIGALDNTELNTIFVPFKYNADGSGRLPDTSAAQIKLFNDTIYKVYPSSKVTITVHAAVPWADAIGADGTGWDGVLQALIDLRQTDNPPANSYYVGIFEPTASLADFCGQGCVLGIAPAGVGPGDVYDRISTTIGYTGSEGPDTITQELAHSMGRLHAPCGNPQAVDAKYPYSGGKIGVWGYNVLTNAFVNPASPWKDFMSYCSPIWTSDYTYKAIASRLSFVNKAAMHRDLTPPGVPETYQWISVKPDGSLVPSRTMKLNVPPQGTEHALTFETATGKVVSTGTAHQYSYGAGRGGFMFVPVAPSGATHLRVEGMSSTKAIALAR